MHNPLHACARAHARAHAHTQAVVLSFGGAAKIFGLNELAPQVPEPLFDRPKARKKIRSNLLGGGGGGGRGGAESVQKTRHQLSGASLLLKRTQV